LQYLFSKEGNDALGFLKNNRANLYAFDFDGTLTGIFRRPMDALLSDSTRHALEQLAKAASVAVVSGRALSSLQTLVPTEGIWLVGNHGIEGMHWDPEFVGRIREITNGWSKILTNSDWAGRDTNHCELEDKIFTLSLHYRNALNPEAARQAIFDFIPRLQPAPRTVFGKYVINLVPPQAPDKGQAILEMMKLSHSTQALYVGDDCTDEDVFRLGQSSILTVRIGQDPESQARFYLKTQTEMDLLLECLLRQSNSAELPLAGSINKS